MGIDLHRRRSVMVRTTESGEVLESVRILNDFDRLNSVMERAGQDPHLNYDNVDLGDRPTVGS